MALTNSPRLNLLLLDMGLQTPMDVVFYLPRKYVSFALTPRSELFHLEDKQRVTLHGRIGESPRFQRFKNYDRCTFFFRTDDGMDLTIEAWNRPYLRTFLFVGQDYTLQAAYDANAHKFNMLTMRKGAIAEENSTEPIYTLPKDYPEHSFRQLVAKCLKMVQGQIVDILPDSLIRKYKLLPRYEALCRCHFPKNSEDVRQGMRVLKYEEALLFSIKNQLIRGHNKSLAKDRRRMISTDLLNRFISQLPYELTASQASTVKEAIDDMNQPTLMSRLLQGDVGSGKTLVAAILLYGNHLRSCQGALMAPTDALARQHYENLVSLFEGTGMTITLLVGAMTPSERKAALADIKDGTSDIVVGTHALFSKDVDYAYLGLAVIDEQHKFGVNQRTLLASKGEHADLLLMSATPIPRTLSLTLYGDLDVSTLREFPSLKRNVTTSIERNLVGTTFKLAKESLEANKRVYVVAPQIEGKADDDSTSVLKVYEEWNARFPHKVVMVHGKMENADKEAALLSFKTGLCPILVATSVIEVGIDVKAANLMIIYSPTHFALSSLHQLRGRIGRDGTPSRCILLYDGKDEEDLDKLNVLTKSEDGFFIAEEDLRRRGPGELAGTKQAGLPGFSFANIVTDLRMFECARDDAAIIVHDQNNPEYCFVLSQARQGK